MLLFVKGENQTTPARKGREPANSTHFISQNIAFKKSGFFSVLLFVFFLLCFVFYLRVFESHSRPIMLNTHLLLEKKKTLPA